MLIFIKRPNGTVNFYFNRIRIGYAYMEVDGYYVFMFNKHDGFWSVFILKEIAEKLSELNKEWDKKVRKQFNTKK